MKIQTKDYKNAGAYPIVDQGQALTAGWTESRDAVIYAPLPLIVFGDHSRTFKYVDRPFARGADGTQLLRPVDEIDPLFFFYACRAIDLPSRGYNRHFTLLKEKSFSYPSDGVVQRSIAALLSRVERALLLQDELVALLEQVKAAAMHQLFSRGLRGEAQKETEMGPVPDSWVKVSFRDLGRIVTGTTPSTKVPEYYEGGQIPFISPGDITTGVAVTEAQKVLTQEGLEKARPLPRGTTLVVCIGSSIGKVGQTTGQVSATNQQINAIVAGSEFEPDYVFHLVTRHADVIRRAASPSPVPILSKGPFETLELYTSKDPLEQREIAQVISSLDRKIDLHRRKGEVLDQLFESLLHKLMTGEVSVDALDLSVLPKLEGSAA
ncbi:MAG: restriction endonuclease subunit S [Nocardioides alkalitolerans]